MTERMCSEDGKPCPKRGSSTTCEQNGVCQRVDMNTLPRLELRSRPIMTEMLQVDDLVVGPCMVRAWRERITELETALAAATAENERLRLPPDETLSEHPGCVYCMEAGTPVRPGMVCPKCGDRLPTKREYEADRLEAENEALKQERDDYKADYFRQHKAHVDEMERRIAAEAANEALKHDIGRHVKIASELATENEALNKANTDLATESATLRGPLSELVASVDGMEDLDEADGEEFQVASKRLETATEAARPFTEEALIAGSSPIEALKRDAERYRWLRDTLQAAVGGGVEVNDARLVYEESTPGEEVRVYWYPDTPIGFYQIHGNTLDAAIDTALEVSGTAQETGTTK